MATAKTTAKKKAEDTAKKTTTKKVEEVKEEVVEEVVEDIAEEPKTNDAEVIEYLFNKGFKKNMRTWRYWSIEGKPWIEELKKLFGIQTLSAGNYQETKPEIKPKEKKPIKIFSVRTTSGLFEYPVYDESSDDLMNALRERFPKLSIEKINKIINNPSNYRYEKK